MKFIIEWLGMVPHWRLLVSLAVLAVPALAVAVSALVSAVVQWAVRPIGTFIDLSTERLHFLDCGAGPPVLLIHGLAGNLRYFSYGLMQPLAKRFRVIAVDRPGCGYSSRKAGAAQGLHAQADAIAELMRGLGLESAVVVGHSLGGAVALALAQRHPQRVAALALIAPLTSLQEEVPAAFRALAITRGWLRRVVGWTLATPGTIARSPRTIRLVFGPEAAPRDFAIRGGGLLVLRPVNFIAASTDLNSVPGDLALLQTGYASLAMPVHVLFGRQDRILNWRTHGEEWVARVPGARLTLIAGGHMLPVTQVQACIAWIEGVANGAPKCVPAN